MFGFAPNMEIEGLLGSELQQVCVGKYDVQFRFASETLIAVQGSARILKNDRVISTWAAESSWDTAAFQELLNLSVTQYAVTSDDLLRLELGSHLVLEVIDNSDKYESVQIYPKGEHASMVVI